MTLKVKLTKAEYDALPEGLRAAYKADGDSYLLDAEGTDDVNELRRAKEREATTAKNEKLRADDLQRRLDAVVDPTKANDIKTLEESWKNKHTTEIAAKDVVIKNIQDALNKVLVKDQAKTIAIELAGDDYKILLPHLESRLAAELEEGTTNAKTRVLDANGKPSASSVDDLKKEFVDNKDFSRIIIATKASGGASGKRTEHSAAVLKNKKFNELTSDERTAWFNEDPDGFKAASKANAAANRKF